MDFSPSGQKFSPGDSAEPRHTGKTFLIPWVRYPYPTLMLMMNSYYLTWAIPYLTWAEMGEKKERSRRLNRTI